MRRGKPIWRNDFRPPRALSGRGSAAVERGKSSKGSAGSTRAGNEFSTGAGWRRTIFVPATERKVGGGVYARVFLVNPQIRPKFGPLAIGWFLGVSHAPRVVETRPGSLFSKSRRCVGPTRVRFSELAFFVKAWDSLPALHGILPVHSAGLFLRTSRNPGTGADPWGERVG